MKLSQVIRDYFTFNRQEQRGLFVLIAILLCLVAFNLIMKEIRSGQPVDFSMFDKEVMAFESAMKRMDSIKAGEKKSRYLNYPLKYKQRSYDSLNSHPVPAREILIIELNSADTFDLQRLNGIGPAFARRIVRYRERLGGFTDKSQVREVFGMDTARYDLISGHLTVNPDSVHRINLNTVTFKELLSHPYFPFEITKAIMMYRKDHKQFRDISELRNIPLIDDSVFMKINAYLEVH
jgi:DNA uptake protein ComE-like DNA-binding protein